MTYPGDPSLTPDIQSRVLSTFDQTAKLATDGKLQEARLGCDFILRLDPLFTPAKRLQERLHSADGPIQGAADLMSQGHREPPQPEMLKTVRLSTEDLQRLIGETDPPEIEPDPEIEHGPLAELDELDPLTIDVPEGGEKDGLAEATSFLAGARRAIDSGQIEAARRLLDMAGSLDPFSPELLDLRGELDRVTAGPPGAIGGDRIAQLLAEGQRAFDAERYQDAIDCWSRIFLIEIDHDEATRHIQLARDLREEQDRQVEETFYQGVAAADEGRPDRAAAAFRRVLELRPNHMAARDHLDQLGAAAVVAPEPTLAPPPLVSDDLIAPGAVPRDLQVTPEGPARQADPSYRMVARAKRKPVNPFFLIGAAVLLLVGAGAWLLLENWSRLFPNATEEAEAPPENRLAPIVAMHDSGELEGAIAAIQQIGSDSPQYLEARRLLTRWQEELSARVQPLEALTGDDATRHGELVTGARQAYDNGNYLEAARLFTRASAMAPLAAAEAALFDDSKRQLEPIAQQIDLYTQRQWELALPALWRRRGQEPQDKDVHQLLVNSYFNLAVRDLRRGEMSEAKNFITEGTRLDRDDRDLARLEQFVTTYSSRPRDLLFEIYIQHLEFRH